MIRSGFKLLYIALVPLGGFGAGAMYQYVKNPEVYAFFLLAGLALSLVGAFAFADLERQEGEQHGRRMARLPDVPGREG